MSNKNKKHKKNIDNAVKNTELNNVSLETETVSSENAKPTSVEKTHNVETIDFKKMYEKVKFVFLTSVILTCINGYAVTIETAYKYVVQYILSQFTFDTSKIYLVSRGTFLNVFCMLFDVQPVFDVKKYDSESKLKKITTAIKNVYGTLVESVNQFDVDKYYYTLTFVKYQCFVCNGINVVYYNEKMFFMSHELFEKFKNGEMLNDTKIQVIDVDMSGIEHYKKLIAVETTDTVDKLASESASEIASETVNGDENVN